MLNISLYLTTVLIWGSTWLVINFQKGIVPLEVSVFYRFTLASLLLLGWCYFKKLNLRFSKKDHLFLAGQGFFLFGVNYLLCYCASHYIPSGLNAISFSMVLVGNIISSAIFYKVPIRLPLALGAFSGVAGIIAIFWPELLSLDLSSNNVLGMILSLMGGCFASIGNMISIRNQNHKLPVTETNALAMGYGAAFTLGYVLLSGFPLVWDMSWTYMTSFLYLTIFGTIVAFGCYLTLLGRVGGSNAAYALVLTPIVALGISTIYEGFVWTPNVIFGVALILSGNVLILVKKNAKPQVKSSSLNVHMPLQKTV
ncbi:DMT family transporter [Candidatus Bealeia paramacronuclearis]|uniref:DMT family transporter n=1 Tax=Candidatus Bealeia paramacronuclearis TaxID=1921001 RepID=A0ABZ2C5F8_9PROT|nr:DMT family transporter [Candidatus Bealeia paramacronuclearis]